MRFLAVFGLVALAEMATFFWVESRIGLAWALGIALATAVIGSYLVRRAGVSVLARIQRRTREGRLPGRELSDGASILVAGAFLISPGFITDMLGFLLLVPPVQALVHRILSRRLSDRVTIFASSQTVRQSRQGRARSYGGGEIIDVEPLEPEGEG